MIRILFIALLITLSISTAVKVFAEDDNCCSDKQPIEVETTSTEAESTNSDINPQESLFDYTKSTADVKIVNSVPVFTINQNNDSRYNMGYALGKSVVTTNTEYPKYLRAFLDLYSQQQSKYNLLDVVEKLSKSMPCWIREEMEGFADAVSINNDKIIITYKDIVALNTVVLWSKLPRMPIQVPPANPTSVTPISKSYSSSLELSPVSETSDQATIALSMASGLVKESYPIVVSSYSRYYNNFFDKTSAVMVYNLNGISFINIGFEGLISTIAAMNSYGVVINEIQSSDQEFIEVIGRTPPSVVSRLAIESSRNINECKDILLNNKSSIAQTYLISDEVKHIAINTTINKLKENVFTETTDINKLFISNYPKLTTNKDMESKLKYLQAFESSLSLKETLDLFQEKPLFNTAIDTQKAHSNTVFNVIFNPQQKYILALMPTNNLTSLSNDYIKINFEAAEVFDLYNKKDNTYEQYQYEDKLEDQ